MTPIGVRMQPFTIAIPTRDIPMETENMSPAMQAITAQLCTPEEWRKQMMIVTIKMNSRTRLTKRHCPND